MLKNLAWKRLSTMLNKQILNKITTIAFYTAKEILKSRVLLNTLLLGLGLFIVTFIAYSFTYGEPSRIALDFGLGTLSISSVAIALFMGVGLLSDEIKSRTVYIIISRPVPRYAFILGRVIGLSSVLVLNIIILSIITLALYFFIGGSYEYLISWTILFITIEAILMLVIVSLFSLVATKVLAVILSIVIYIVGHAIDGAKLLTFVVNRPILEKILGAYHYLLPGFYKLNLKDHLLYKQTLSSEYLFGNLLYGILYGVALILLSIFIFDRKNLD